MSGVTCRVIVWHSCLTGLKEMKGSTMLDVDTFDEHPTHPTPTQHNSLSYSVKRRLITHAPWTAHSAYLIFKKIVNDRFSKRLCLHSHLQNLHHPIAQLRVDANKAPPKHPCYLIPGFVAAWDATPLDFVHTWLRQLRAFVIPPLNKIDNQCQSTSHKKLATEAKKRKHPNGSSVER